MPTTATLAPPVTFSHSGAWPSYFVNHNKTADNFAPFSWGWRLAFHSPSIPSRSAIIEVGYTRQRDVDP
jgi:hypothetical protein